MCDGDAVLREERNLVRFDDDAVSGKHVRPEQSFSGEETGSRRSRRVDEPGYPLPRPTPVEEVAHLRVTLGDVRRKGQAELRARAVYSQGDAVRRMRRNAQEDTVVEVHSRTRAKLLELLQGVIGVRPEHFQV